MNKTLSKTTKKTTPEVKAKTRQSYRKFETLKVYKAAPSIFKDMDREYKLHFVI